MAQEGSGDKIPTAGVLLAVRVDPIVYREYRSALRTIETSKDPEAEITLSGDVARLAQIVRIIEQSEGALVIEGVFV
jgi:hypothetical protein